MDHMPSQFRTFLPDRILLHPQDALPPPIVSRKLQFGKYNPFNTQIHIASDSLITRAAILVRSAMLKVWSSRNPRLSAFIVMVNPS